MAQNFNTPILLTIFNRPDHARQVFDRIRMIKPKQLFIAADGPRTTVPSDSGACKATRQIVDRVDWDCQIATYFHDSNQGCRIAMQRNINWFFNHVEEGIILEDDCLPDLSFFEFCETLLARFRHDERIMTICGDNKATELADHDGSYYFSRLVHIWGWATWRRAWQFYDGEMKTFPSFKARNAIANIFHEPHVQRFWLQNFQAVFERRIDTWDYQWVFSIFSQNGLSIIPVNNLVSNIGFGPEATHTKFSYRNDSGLPTKSIATMEHPKFVIPDKQMENSIIRKFYLGEETHHWHHPFTKGLRFLTKHRT